MQPTVVELCAGGGGQALGLELAGFECAAAVDIDRAACATLRLNRPGWRVIESDVTGVRGTQFRGIDLLAAGVPCPPFSIAGKQLGRRDERDLFPGALRVVETAKPRAVLLENVPGLASDKFRHYRRRIAAQLEGLGYVVKSETLNASDFGVPQLRPRLIIVALRPTAMASFEWPEPAPPPPTVGRTLRDLMASHGWPGADAWAARANAIAPTIVGGSKKHGGPDLGPTRARRQWEALGVNGLSIANEPPAADFPIDALPRLTLRMVARIQGFPDTWQFFGKKTPAYRQVGNALPPPVAAAVGRQILLALNGSRDETVRQQRLLA